MAAAALKAACWLAVCWLAGWPAAEAAAQEPATGEPAARSAPSFQVSYRSADAVYLDAGRAAGLAEGDRLEVVRDGEAIAEIEVVFVAEHSASCRPLEERQAIRAGDTVRPLGTLAPPAAAAPAPEETGPAAAEPAPPPAPREPVSTAERRRTRLSGVASLDWESFSDGTEAGRDVTLTTGRLDLRGRDLGGLPLSLRARLRSRQVDRERPLSGGAPESEDRDRLYELSLAWDADRWGVEAGRIGLGRYAGIGWLDGAAGRFRVLSGLELGAFYGSRPDVTELGLESSGSEYGVFTRLGPPRDRGRWEVCVAGVRVEGETETGGERERVVLETRLETAGGRLSLFQRAELDLDAGLGGGSGQGSQLTQAAVALTARLGEASRLTLSYDRYEPLLTQEERNDPEARFDELLRQGLRASLRLGRSGGPGLTLSGGLRERDDGSDPTYSAGLGVYHPRLAGLWLGADVLGFSNPLTEGLLVTARARRGFAGGHSLGLAVGSTLYSEELTGEDRSSGWVRLTGWAELPASLFARGEVEVAAGDDREGQRLGLGLGYRF
jgi:hypothetical protein